jgi:hypothetical protein
MSTTRIAGILHRLFDYLGEDQWDLGEIIVDFCDGAKFNDPHTEGLLMELVNEMPDPGNFTVDDLAEEILKVGTEYAVGVANDIHDIEAS